MNDAEEASRCRSQTCRNKFVLKAYVTYARQRRIEPINNHRGIRFFSNVADIGVDVSVCRENAKASYRV